jgi:lysozyme family protein
MADFEAAIAVVLAHEGGLVDDPGDGGGVTKFGISHRTYPDLDIATLTRKQAVAIYRRDWWARYGYGAIRDQALATTLFDLAVLNPDAAHRALQQTLGDLGAPVPVDGVLGPQTLAAIAQVDAECLRLGLQARLAVFLLGLHRPRFVKGWLRRALGVAHDGA